MYRTWTISDQIVFLFEQFFCYLIAGTLSYDLYCRCLRRNVRSLIKKHCSVISIMSRLSNVCVFRHTGHRLSESESISSSYRTRDTIYSICSVKAKISWWLNRCSDQRVRRILFVCNYSSYSNNTTFMYWPLRTKRDVTEAMNSAKMNLMKTTVFMVRMRWWWMAVEFKNSATINTVFIRISAQPRISAHFE